MVVVVVVVVVVVAETVIVVAAAERLIKTKDSSSAFALSTFNNLKTVTLLVVIVGVSIIIHRHSDKDVKGSVLLYIHRDRRD